MLLREPPNPRGSKLYLYRQVVGLELANGGCAAEWHRMWIGYMPLGNRQII